MENPLKQLSSSDFQVSDALYFSQRGPDSLVAIHIRLSILIAGEKQQTSIRLDHIPGLNVDPRKLAGHSFAFPANPAEGYIDGSMYLQGRHHPVDVTALHFGNEHAMQIPLEVEGCILLEEQTRPLAFHFTVPIQLPLTATALQALLEQGLCHTAACSGKDMGRLMAYLKQHLHYEEQIADMAVLAKVRLQNLKD
ncbi:MAG: hypothetical protein HYR68_01095 [Burkholderiales bacterium]|nr:hypothetical protein [Burkholderiales bacterium]